MSTAALQEVWTSLIGASRSEELGRGLTPLHLEGRGGRP